MRNFFRRKGPISKVQPNSTRGGIFDSPASDGPDGMSTTDGTQTFLIHSAVNGKIVEMCRYNPHGPNVNVRRVVPEGEDLIAHIAAVLMTDRMDV